MNEFTIEKKSGDWFFCALTADGVTLATETSLRECYRRACVALAWSTSDAKTWSEMIDQPAAG